MFNKNIDSIEELLQTYSNEQACIEHLEKLRWRNGIVSPFDSTSIVYECKNNKYRCKNTGKYFNVKTNTIFDGTKIGLQKWFIAIWITSHNNKITSLRLANDISVTQKTAWSMLRKIKAILDLK